MTTRVVRIMMTPAGTNLLLHSTQRDIVNVSPFVFQVASSDATNIESSIRREGDEYVINGHKWWTSGQFIYFVGLETPTNT